MKGLFLRLNCLIAAIGTRVRPSRFPANGIRPACRRAHRRFRLGDFRIEVGEYFLDYLGILNARDAPHGATAGRAILEIDTEHLLLAGSASQPNQAGKAS
jgi:hypothetical protein